MRRVIIGLLMLALLVASTISMNHADALAQNCQSVSLRYRQALTAETVRTARDKQSGLTFWAESSCLLCTSLHQTQCTALYYQGDALLVMGAEYCAGEPPAPLDFSGCAISTALADDLFGSEDVLGLSVTLETGEYTVRGIFSSNRSLALIPCEDAGFTAVELPFTEDFRQSPATWVNTQLTESGLPEPDWQLFTGLCAALGRGLAWLPLAFAALVLILHGAKAVVHWLFPARDIALFSVLLTTASALPLLLSVWPSWLTPSRWSDFSWWTQTAQTLSLQLEAFLLAPGMGRDLAIKSGLIAQVGIALLQCVLCEALRCMLRQCDRPAATET